MIKTVMFDSEIHSVSIDSLISTIEPFLEDNEINLYFTSPGGCYGAETVIIDYLNQWQDRITLIAYNSISSAGFHIFLCFEGKKRILPHTFGLVHMSATNPDSKMLKDKNSRDYLDSLDCAAINQEAYELYKPFLTRKELQDFKKGRDIILMPERMHQIFA